MNRPEPDPETFFAVRWASEKDRADYEQMLFGFGSAYRRIDENGIAHFVPHRDFWLSADEIRKRIASEA